VIGVIKLLKLLFMLVSGVYRHFIRKPKNLYEQYAKDENSWTLVTGASDGFGAEFCR
jgi:hypothetical protein